VLLSSTMGHDVRVDIERFLHLKDPAVIIRTTTFDRPNLQYFSHQQPLSSFMTTARPYLDELKDGSAIIFAQRREDVDRITMTMSENGFSARPYHSAIVEHERSRILANFMSGRLKIVVATVALGCGIDQNHVRLVIHTFAPKSAEIYYQESGRAGRDGRPAKCVLFWDTSNFGSHRYWIRRDFASRKITGDAMGVRERHVAAMTDYAMTAGCRRQKLLDAVDGGRTQVVDVRTETCCDMCARVIFERVAGNLMFVGLNSRGSVDATDGIRTMLRIVGAYNGECRDENLMDMLLGNHPKTFSPFHPLHLFRSGRKRPRDWHEFVQRVITDKKLIERRGDATMVVGKEGKFVLRRKNVRVMVALPPEICCRHLTRTASEFYIENGEVKSRPRVEGEIEESVVRVGCGLGFLKRNGVYEEIGVVAKKVKMEAGCSHWSGDGVGENEDDVKVLTGDGVRGEGSDEADDEHVENMKAIREQTMRKIDVKLDDFLDFIENRDDDDDDDDDDEDEKHVNDHEDEKHENDDDDHDINDESEGEWNENETAVCQ
jgi:superfamily II DNA helicase RecQ